MNTTNIIEQQRYDNLDLIYSNLSFAYLNDDTYKMKYYLQKFVDDYSEYFEQMDNCVRCIFYEHGCTFVGRITIDNAFGNDLKYNIEGCLITIKNVMNKQSYRAFSLGAIQTLYYPKQRFVSNSILYKKEYPLQQPTQGATPTDNPIVKETRNLTVSDLLSVTDYSMKILDALSPSEKTQDVSDAITVLKSVDLALNNKPQDKPVNKSLHVVNSVLSSVIKKSLDDKSDKQFVGGMSILIDLAIDFFCKK